MSTTLPMLIVHAGGRDCALPLVDVGETMRPLPVQPTPGSPPCVLGYARIRGAFSVVVDLATVLGAPSPTPPTRFVSITTGARPFVLAVGDVRGVADVDEAMFETLPPLLSEASQGTVHAVSSLGRGMLLILRSARLLPDRVSSPDASLDPEVAPGTELPPAEGAAP